MYMNIFSTRVDMDRLPEITELFETTMTTLASSTAGFRGMMGLFDDSTGDVVSIALNEDRDQILNARESESNVGEVARYAHLFRQEPTRDLYRVDVRYMPQNRPFPGVSAFFARCTSGFVAPDRLAQTIATSRDTLIYSAIFEKGCAGFLLGSEPRTGRIFGISMWESAECMQASEGARGYYNREMARYDNVLTSPAIRRHYRIFNRLITD